MYSTNTSSGAFAVTCLMGFIVSRGGKTWKAFSFNSWMTVVTICTAQWSLYVPHSGHYMYRIVVTICTTSLTFNNSTFCPHSVFMCFVWISEQTAFISLYNINWLVFIPETKCVYCAVRTESFNTFHIASIRRKVIYVGVNCSPSGLSVYWQCCWQCQQTDVPIVLRLSHPAIAVPTCQHLAVANSPVYSARGQVWSGSWNFPWDTLLFGRWCGVWVLLEVGSWVVRYYKRRLSTAEHLNQKQR